MQTTTQSDKFKQCDDSCEGTDHCAHPTCHQGGYLENMFRCHSCDEEFCIGHIYRIDLDEYSCAPCEIKASTANPITLDHAKSLLRLYGIAFTFQVKPMHPTAKIRTARISRDTGIIYEGGSF